MLSQNQLITSLAPFPSQCLALNGRDGARFQSWRSWSQNDQMQLQFVTNDAQSTVIDGMRGELGSTTGAVHVRVRGGPGIGKTRLVLESLRAADLAPLVVYSSDPQDVRTTVLDEIIKEDNLFEVILVVDECTVEHAVLLWDRLKHRGARIRLVTIYNEFDHLDLPYLDAPPLGRTDTERIQ